MDTTDNAAVITATTPEKTKQPEKATGGNAPSPLDAVMARLRDAASSSSPGATLPGGGNETGNAPDATGAPGTPSEQGAPEAPTSLADIASLFIFRDEDATPTPGVGFIEDTEERYTFHDESNLVVVTAVDGESEPSDLTDQIGVLAEMFLRRGYPYPFNVQLVIVSPTAEASRAACDALAEAAQGRNHWNASIAEHGLCVTVASPEGIYAYDPALQATVPLSQDEFPVSRFPMAELAALSDRYGAEDAKAIFKSYLKLAGTSRDALRAAGAGDARNVAVRLLKDDMRHGGREGSYCDPRAFTRTVLRALAPCRITEQVRNRDLITRWLRGAGDDLDNPSSFEYELQKTEPSTERAEQVIAQIDDAASALRLPLSDIAFLGTGDGASPRSLTADGFTSRKCDVIISRLERLASEIARGISALGETRDAMAEHERQERSEREFFSAGAEDVSGAASFMTCAQRRLAEGIFDEYNSYREGLGLSPCKWSEECADMAYAGARGCARSGKLSHRLGIPEDAQGSFSDVLQYATWEMDAGEPIGKWARSAGHAAQMMCPSAKDAAVAVYEGHDGTWYYALVYDFNKVNQGHVDDTGKVVPGAPAPSKKEKEGNGASRGKRK